MKKRESEDEQQRRLNILAVVAVLVILLPWWLAAGVKAASAAAHGTGFKAAGGAGCYRAYPGGPAITTPGDPAAPDPWFGAAYNAPLSPAGSLRFIVRYGFSDADNRGGYCNSPGNEIEFRLVTALIWMCQNQPTTIRSSGAAGGHDCVPLTEEVKDAAIFDQGWSYVWAYEHATGGHVPTCGDTVCDYGEEFSSVKGCISDCHTCSNGAAATCATCPDRMPAGACTPPPPPPACPACPPAPVQCVPPDVCGRPVTCPALLPIPQQTRANCAVMLANSNISPVLKARIRQVCGVISAAAAYHPGVPSTARNELTLAECLGVAP
jgi:hypothetical protein